MFGILGATRVVGADGAEVALGGPRRRAVLALLLLDAGRAVPAERLIDGLYGDDPPAGAGNAVQSQISRLRQVLPVPLEGLPAGYRLAVAPDEVDAHRFRRLSAEGRAALAAGDPVLAERLLRTALALWRGPALADVGAAPFAAAQITRLEELRAGAVEDRVDADLALGRHRSLVAELGELVTAHPLRERPRGQLMRALYGSGRQSEALEAYEEARRELADSLGADPGPELAAVHLAVLRGDPALLPRDISREAPRGAPGVARRDVPRDASRAARRDVPQDAPQDVPRETDTADRVGADGHVPRGTSTEGAAGSGDGAPAPAPPRHELPAQLTSFVGRSAELERIGEQLARQRLVTLTGPGGAGKTRLAVEAAGRYAHDACFVPLAGLSDGAELPQAVLGALGLRAGGLLAAGSAASGGAGHDPGPHDPVARITAALDGRPLLLVLDNCEHVVEDAARLAERLLAGSPLLRLLATSREALGINGETLCPVPTLDVPRPGTDREQALRSPAVRLFTERAAAVRPDLDLDATADPATVDAVLRLCTALDGLPLAIELAAARLRSLSVTDIADRLGALPDDDAPYSLGVRPDALFRLLSRGSRTAQPRQRTLRGVVDWSWDLLPDDERAVLRRVSVFAGGWTPAAAEAVCADGARILAEDVLDLLDALVDKSLVVAEQPDGAGRIRYRALESIRAYGAERLTEAGEREATVRAHAAYFLDFALTADPHLRRAEQLEWLRLLGDERDNLQAALHRSLEAGEVRTAMRLIAALSSYWLLRGVRYEGFGPARQVLAALGPNPPEGMEEEYALCVMAVVGMLPDPEEFADHVAAATRVVEAMHRLSRRYPVLTLLWAPFAGVPDEGIDVLEAVFDEFLTERDHPWYRALILLGSGFQSWLTRADPVAARIHCTASYEEFRRLGDRWGMITNLNVLADLADHRGELALADSLLDDALLLAEELDSALDMAELLCIRAAYSTKAGDYATAAAYSERAVELSRRAGTPECLALAHLALAESVRLRGDGDGARALYEQALAECPVGWFSSNGTRSAVLVALGRVAVADRDPDLARGHFREAVTLDSVAMRLPLNGAVAAEATAGLALLNGDAPRAAALLGAAEALRGRPPTGPDAAATVAAVRAALGDEAYERERARAAALDRDAALAVLTAYLTAD
ncbi:BTAD domain-containing putative transcriptional regulator [Streptomyces sp. NPDC008079]|uniref:AfsR/SARP family transcriptional regulator n=1 Tax=Streptomyces sp. NPDC008079 TaxID=3364806 RepID=UPI0036EE4D5E